MPEGTGAGAEAGGGGDPFDWSLRIPNRLDLLSGVRALVGSTCELHGVEGDEREELLLAVSELVNNAIEHVQGRPDDGYHEVEMRFGIGGGVAVGTVLDQGVGNIAQGSFDGAGMPALDDDRGRGLFLIKAYVDDIRVRAIPGVGTEIRFRKRVAAGGGQA
jgi:anti-sigma regulatory factor (Ser/Thr protein kinase)